MWNSIDNLGKSLLDWPKNAAKLFVFIYLSFRSILSLKYQNFRPILFVIISQIYFTGVQAVPLISFIALMAGSIVVLQCTGGLSLFASPEMMGNILVVTIIRELGPLLTALIVIARSGTAVATELGNMKVNKEIEALRSLSIEPLSYVVFPRLIGGMISLICLAFYFNFVALTGGFLVANLVHHLSFDFYISAVANSIAPEDFILNMIKNVTSGAIIFAVACDQGLKVNLGPQEVPISTTKAVVKSIVYVMGFNMSLTISMLSRNLI
ncbi:MAG: MlaE family ABC transporter permease [Bacteriovoracaceae bacterium]